MRVHSRPFKTTTKKFFNPAVPWQQQGGPFFIELTEGADIRKLPSYTTVNGRIVTIKKGGSVKLAKERGEFQFVSSDGKLFGYKQEEIVAIRMQDDEPLWMNDPEAFTTFASNVN